MVDTARGVEDDSLQDENIDGKYHDGNDDDGVDYDDDGDDICSLIMLICVN